MVAVTPALPVVKADATAPGEQNVNVFIKPCKALPGRDYIAPQKNFRQTFTITYLEGLKTTVSRDSVRIFPAYGSAT
jgi:hypothetical protein